jgi:hypothetical protein
LTRLGFEDSKSTNGNFVATNHGQFDLFDECINDFGDFTLANVATARYCINEFCFVHDLTPPEGD